MFLAHGPISYVLNEVIQKKNIKTLSNQEQLLVMILSILFGIFPDIDLAILSMTNIPGFQHHLIFTHSILYFIVLWILLILILKVLKRILRKQRKDILSDRLINVIHISFLVGTLSHLLADLLFSYVRILFPLESQITILGGVLKSNLFASYLLSPIFATELIAVSIFILFVFKKYIRDIKPVKFSIYILISLTSILLIFSVYMNLNIYNNQHHFENGRKISDIDYDGVLDRQDLDTNGNGIYNIYEVDKEKVATFVEDISNSRYMVVYNRDTTVEKIKYMYGALDSYRVISQAYFEQNLAIEPILKEYVRKKYDIQKYMINISYSDTLYEYLCEIGTAVNTNIGNYRGSIFFLVENDTAVNMGIVLGENSFGTVLNGDTKLITHTLDEILKEYPKAELKVVSIP